MSMIIVSIRYSRTKTPSKETGLSPFLTATRSPTAITTNHTQRAIISGNMRSARPDVVDRESSCALARETSCDVHVGMTEGRGRGLFASRAMAEGATALIERCDPS